MEGMFGVQKFRVTVHGRISAAAEDFLLHVEKREETAPVPVPTMRGMLTERLTAAAEEIVGLFERTVADHERRVERSERERRLFDAALKPRVRLNRVDIQPQQMIIMEDDPSEQEQRHSLMDQGDLEPLVIMKIEEGEEKPFCCTECDKKYIFKNSLKNHMLVHREEKPFSCHYCGKRFRRMTAMKLHLRIHKLPGFKCYVCRRGFTCKRNMDRHIRLFHTKKNLMTMNEEHPSQQRQQSPLVDQDNSEPPFFKDEPNTVLMSQEGQQLEGSEETDIRFTFTSVTVKTGEDEEEPQSLQPHQCDTDDNRVNCGETEAATDSCPDQHLQPKPEIKMESSSVPDSKKDAWQEIRENQNRLNLGGNNSNVSVVEGETDQESLICSICDQRFTEQEQLHEHLLVHMRGEPLIGKGFSNKSSREPSAEKQFKCTECDTRSFSKYGLRKHMLVHTGGGPFSCTECDKTYCFKNSLRQHMFIHTGQEPFSCTGCDRRFISKNHLKKHMVIHTAGAKTFGCHHCSKRFRLKRKMQEHLRLHTVLERFNCSVCGQGFTRKGYMERHIKLYHREKKLKNEEDPSEQPQQIPVLVQLHTGLEGFNCSVCGQGFTRKGNMDRHIRLFHREENLTNEEDPSEQQQQSQLVVRLHTGLEGLNCSVCGQGFTRKGNMDRHIRLFHGEENLTNEEDSQLPFFKDEPNTVLMSQEGQQLHGFKETDTRFTLTSVTVKTGKDDKEEPQSSQIHQCDTDENRVNCGEMETAATSGPDQPLQPIPEIKMESSSEPDNKEDVWKEIREHQTCLNPGDNNSSVSVVEGETDKESLICSLCDQVFTEEEQLHMHLLIHMRGEPLIGKGISRKSGQKSARCWFTEKRFRCTKCDKIYFSKYGLRKHLLIHTGEGPFSCTECDKKYCFKNSLRQHMLVHTGEEPFSCAECDRRFISKNHLKKHMVIHTAGAKTFGCHHCGKRFRLKRRMQEHLRLHTVFKRFNCSVCGQGFMRKGYMERHIKLYHRAKKLKNEEGPSEQQQQQSPLVDQDDSEPPFFEVEPNTVLMSHEGQQLQGSEETDIRFTLAVAVKSEEDEEEPQLHQCDTDENRVNCGGTEVTTDSGPDQHLQPGPGDQMANSTQTESKEDGRQEIREHQASLNPSVSVIKGETDKESFICSLCDQTFTEEEQLEVHLLVHVGQKPLNFPEFGKGFDHQNGRNSHMLVHTQEKLC